MTRYGLVLAGAVAQGGFEAGALGAFAAEKPSILSVVGTSSGALNATVAAAGIAAGRLDVAANVLKKLWIDHGSWVDIADAPVSDWLHLRGVFDTRRLQGLVVKALGEVLAGWNGQPAPVTLTVVTTNLNALPRTDPALPLPTHEQAIQFTEKDLVDEASWARIASAAAASATFPAMFAPTPVDGSPCIDGGAVNNAAISYALEDDDVDAVVVVTTESSTVPQLATAGGGALVARVAAAMINERIAHDLATAKKANDLYAAVARALDDAGISGDKKAKVLAATGYRPVALYLVQPASPLAGDAFSGFFHREQRVAYVAAGEAAPRIQVS